MTDLQKVQMRQSVIRSRLSEIAGLESTDEIRQEIDTLGREYGTNETSIRAYIIAADGEPPEVRSTEDRQRAELLKQANVGQLVDDLVGGRSGTAGAMQEYQREHGLAANEISVRMLRDDEVETRAVTSAPGQVGQLQQPIIPYVFPMAVAAFMGIDMPIVGVGDAVFPVLTSDLAVRTPAEHAEAAESTGQFSAQVLTPSRLQASFYYSVEDKARFAGLDSALRENLSAGLSDGLDDVIMSGTNGLLTGTILANHAAAAVTTFDDYVVDFGYGRVDGRFAGSVGDIRVVMGSASYAHAGNVYRATESDRPALDRMMAVTGGVRVSAHVPALSNANKQNNLIRLGMRSDYIAPIWENLVLVPDSITRVKYGEVVITAIMLYAAKLLRADGFHKQEVQTA